jgi:hypothetical protein
MVLHSQCAGKSSSLPLDLIAQAVPMLSRHELARLAERLLDRLDELTPDCDFEDGDPAGQADEDGTNTGPQVIGMHGQRYARPGRPLSDGVG